MSYFTIWICYNLKIECVKDDSDNNVSISLLIRENRHIDNWNKVLLKPEHLKKLIKIGKESLGILKNKKLD